MKSGLIFIVAGFILAGVTQASLPNRTQIPYVEIVPTVTPTVPVPLRLSIPAIGVDAPVESVGMDSLGRMATPSIDTNTAWYNLGTKPGEPGNAVIDGHLDTPTGPSVFYRLSELKIGDELTVTSENGKTFTFLVYDRKIYSDADFPIVQVFGNDPIPRLNLITCDGIFDSNASNYSHRLVVYSILKNKPAE